MIFLAGNMRWSIPARQLTSSGKFSAAPPAFWLSKWWKFSWKVCSSFKAFFRQKIHIWCKYYSTWSNFRFWATTISTRLSDQLDLCRKEGFEVFFLFQKGQNCFRFWRKFSNFFGTKFGHYLRNLSARFYRIFSPCSNKQYWERKMCFWKQFLSVSLFGFRAKTFPNSREIFQQGSQKCILLVQRIILGIFLSNET